MSTKCQKVFRVSIHPSIKMGGATVGKCQNDAAPGLNCCWEHAEKETLIHYIQMLLKEREQLLSEKSPAGEKKGDNRYLDKD
jgi:hypothetical protein